MLQQFIELSLLLIGLYALLTGKLPLAFGSNPTHRLGTRAARLVGLLFIAPFPMLLCAGVSLGLLGMPLEKASFIEPLLVLLIIIAAVAIIQKSKKTVDAMDDGTKETL